MKATEPVKRILAQLHRQATDLSQSSVARLWAAQAARLAPTQRVPAFGSHTQRHRQMVMAVVEAAREETVEVERTLHATLWNLLEECDAAYARLDRMNLNPGTRRWLARELNEIVQIIHDGLEGRTP